MNELMDTQPIVVRAKTGNIIFYFGTEPNGLARLPAKSEFTLVYSPFEGQDWEAVHYCVVRPQKAYSVLNRRSLSPQEKKHFEALLKNAPRQQHKAG